MREQKVTLFCSRNDLLFGGGQKNEITFFCWGNTFLGDQKQFPQKQFPQFFLICIGRGDLAYWGK